ncbi:hypothetical protein ABIB57_003642 [Devosia sp. UYZn731]|uniref:hypothetical protein n=1 Tax=Devosia sp. UYZn731 TaxID=3156345 RepID=UPI00339A06C0
MKHQGYLNRALKSSDRRYARIFDKLGYDVAALQTEAGKNLVPIPDGWRELAWADLRALAKGCSGEPIKSKADAVAAIELEAERRKANS